MTVIKKSQIIHQVMESLDAMQGLDDRITSILLRNLRFREDGFEVLRVENGNVVFSVPKQDSKKWFFGTTLRDSQLTSEKLSLGLDIKEKFGLAFCALPEHSGNIVGANMRVRLRSKSADF